MKKILVFLVLLFSVEAFSQEITARKLVEEAVKKESPQEALSYINAQLEKITLPAEKRSVYAFLGSLQESLCDYSGAQKSYAMAAGIAAGNVAGMPKKSSERLVLDAVRCALSEGDCDNAENYLNSAVRNSKSAEIQALVKLYEQWCVLSRSETPEDLNEPVAILKTYLEFESMNSVRPSILLTLWYITSDSLYAKRLNKEFPSSMEAGIVNGKVLVYPAPFWYFLPRKQAAVPEIPAATEPKELAQSKAAEASEKTAETKSEQKAIPKKQQLGLFRDKENAQTFAEKVKAKGFAAYVHDEVRSSGTTYYIVSVDENQDGTMGLKLKSAGFECYPVF